ncbi:MAG: MlaD family protein [Rhizomicrobium sp.]
METKANYIAVGAFVLACMLALVVTVLWLAGVQYSQEFVYYQTTFTGSVTGLGKGTVVRYNGIEVGRVDSWTSPRTIRAASSPRSRSAPTSTSTTMPSPRSRARA